MENFEEFHNELINACKNDDIKQAKKLFEEKKHILGDENDHDTLLLYACWIGNKEIVETIIKHGDAVSFTKNGKNALTVAFEMGHHDLVLFLLSKEADFNCQHGFNLLMENCGKNDTSLNELELLMNNKAPTIGDEPNDRFPLLIASENGFVEKVQFLLKNSTLDINKKNKFAYTPLHCATANDHKYVAKLLIENGANMNEKNLCGETPLHLALFFNHLDIANMLIENGANVNESVSDKETPLHLALEAGHQDIVKLLIEKGAYVNAENLNKETPLHFASKSVNRDVVKLLIEKGAHVNAKNFYKETPLHLAVEDNHQDIVKLLIENGAFVNEKDKKGRTPLHKAARYGKKTLLNY